MKKTLVSLAFLATCCGPAVALDFPNGSERTAEKNIDLGRYEFPIAPFNGERVPTAAAEGALTLEAWRVAATSMTSFQLLTSLRDQLVAEGYETVFQCQAVSCGGYDFRFSVGQFSAPELFIDLGAYHYFTAKKGDDYVGMLISHGQTDGYIQLARITRSTAAPVSIAPPTAVANSTVAHTLENDGHVVLAGVNFATGSADLSETDVPALTKLAAYLAENPARNIVLVGHTDSQGGLAGNIAISKKRAGAVLRVLVENYQVNPEQLSAEGAGYLAPLSSNLTEAGRSDNRRVEAVLTNVK